MAKFIIGQINLTNVLVACLGFAGALWVNTVIHNQEVTNGKIDELTKLVVQVVEEKKAMKEKLLEIDKGNEKRDDRLDKIQGVSAIDKLFKNEQFYTLK